MPSPSPNTERLTAACVLSMVGGFLDIYTYLYRGGVFANAVTGNIVLLGLNLAVTNWGACGRYLLAIFFYALGVFASGVVQHRLADSRRVVWHQVVLALEMLCLVAAAFIPYGELDFIVNGLISFVCAMQAQSFRLVHGLPFASTMCTGNLRSGTHALFNHLVKKEDGELGKAFHYYLVILCFIAGAVGGTLLLKELGPFALLAAPAGLLVALLLVSSKRQLVLFRKTLFPRE